MQPKAQQQIPCEVCERNETIHQEALAKLRSQLNSSEQIQKNLHARVARMKLLIQQAEQKTEQTQAMMQVNQKDHEKKAAEWEEQKKNMHVSLQKELERTRKYFKELEDRFQKIRHLYNLKSIEQYGLVAARCKAWNEHARMKLERDKLQGEVTVLRKMLNLQQQQETQSVQESQPPQDSLQPSALVEPIALKKKRNQKKNHALQRAIAQQNKNKL